jgi:hypothetical protein
MFFIFAIFGTQEFVHIPKHQQSKMNPKATKCIFIGWDETTKGFCCYNPVIKKIVTMQHVKINELKILITNTNLTKEHTSTFDFQWTICYSYHLH